MDYRNVYEKLWLAHAIYEASWDGAKYRLFSESAIDYVLDDADHDTAAWWQYARLQGRSQDFWEFLQRELDVPSSAQDAYLSDLWVKWATPKVRRWVATQVNSHKIIDWPAWIPMTERAG